MSCCGSENSKSPESYQWPWLVNLVYWFTEKIFHSFYPKGSEKRHQQVMRLFQFCADREHVTACSVYGHILLFRGVTPWDKKQGVDYLLAAADQEDPKAAYQVAELMLKHEHGLTTNEDEVLKYLMLAAKSDHVLAQKRLGRFVEEHSELTKKLTAEESAYIAQLNT